MERRDQFHPLIRQRMKHPELSFLFKGMIWIISASSEALDTHRLLVIRNISPQDEAQKSSFSRYFEAKISVKNLLLV